ncbi:unnamed protein product [Ilex paraguariensis]|uniref:UDP-glycosyltransferase n=1 Tax=Ilex paraguariensis TaxID=185542 RepID=A0ABC8S894_9AQUA
MSNSTNRRGEPPHIAILQSGLGQSNPFFRLAAMLASHNCTVTFIMITTQPTVSAAESTHISSFFSSHPEINRIDFDIPAFNTSSSTTNDPFIVHFEAINHSIHLLVPVLSSLPRPPSAIFSDFVVAAGLSQIIADLDIPHYIVSTTSARFFSTVAYLPVLISETPSKFGDNSADVEIPGLDPLLVSSIPPTWLDDSPWNYLLRVYLIPNAQSLPKVKGVLINTFNWFEAETIVALNKGMVLSNLPTVFPIGPLNPHELKKCLKIPWLDLQCAESVVYVNCGSREPMPTDQLIELGNALEISGCTFLWILKGNKMQKVGNDEELRELLGDTFIERTKNKGRILKGWVNQEEILAHPAIGGFVSQCEWDSVMEAARQGVPMLAWPQHGDQKMNAEVMEKAGLGVWAKDWGWDGERLVKGEEIKEMVKQVMEDVNLRGKAMKIREEARKAWEVGGSSEKELMGLIEMLIQKEGN